MRRKNMAKIAKVKVENFRNLKSVEFLLTDTTVISGMNGLGKSNLLNALVWFFTDKIYSDVSGKGENDIESICPIDQQKGEHTSVEVTSSDGVVFKKMYKTGYDRNTGKVNKHTTEWYINGISCKNAGEFTLELDKQLNFSSCFRTVNEKQLFTDCLYLLQKVQPKELRQFIAVDLKCNVSNDDIFAMGFEDLKQYEKTYLGDFVKMRQSLKQDKAKARDDIQKYETLLEPLNAVTKFDNNLLFDCKAKLDKLRAQKVKLQSGNVNEAIVEFEHQLENIKIALNAERDKKIADLDIKIKELEGKKAIEENDISNAKRLEMAEVTAIITKLNSDIKSNELAIKNYERVIATVESSVMTASSNGKNLQERKRLAENKLVTVNSSEFTGYCTCPNCQTTFAPDESKLEEFKKHKAEELEAARKEITYCSDAIKSAASNFKQLVASLEATKKEKAEAEKSLIDFKQELANAQSHLVEVETTQVDTTRLNEIKAKIESLIKERNSIPPIDKNPKIIELEAKLDKLRVDSTSVNDEEIAKINAEINKYADEEENLLIARSDWESKENYMRLRQEAVKKENDVDYLIGRVNEFIHKMIEELNNRATEKLGVKFVMLEENLNESISEVCYAEVDGVPFKDVNTATKYATGIKVIEHLKDIVVNEFKLPRNELPILADKFEGIDTLEKIKSLTKEQLVCTRVTEAPSIEIL